jgi:transposase InsO family protein
VVDQVCQARWTVARICGVLKLDPTRVWRWRQRAAADRLDDQPGGGNPVHALTPAERAEIVAVAEEWKDVDRSHRKLAHRGSYEHRFWASPSSVRRVVDEEDVELPAPPPGAPAAPVAPPDRADLPWQPDNIWIYDVTHFTRAKRAATAIMDVVSRLWVTTVVSAEETSLQVEVAFTQGLQAPRADGRHHRPARRAHPARPRRRHPHPGAARWSDNGPQMTSADPRSFMALHLIATHYGRPHTPTDQAWIESLFGHVKGENPLPVAACRPGRARSRIGSLPPVP